MKRLLAGGLHRIYTICRCFRGDEAGVHHSREFSMVEWYRGESTMEAVVEDTREICRRVVREVSGGGTVVVGGRPVDVGGAWTRLTVREAMLEFAGVDVVGVEDAETLLESALGAGVDVGTATVWDDVFFCAFVERVEPALAKMPAPVILDEWPLPLAALARRKPGSEAVAERFEVYIGGVELANGFGELTCAAEQRARFEADNAVRAARGLDVYPLDEKFLAALASGMPESGGVALGVDRLVMLATGASSIAEVQAFGDEEL